MQQKYQGLYVLKPKFKFQSIFLDQKADHDLAIFREN
jgi:hypothetical protein